VISLPWRTSHRGDDRATLPPNRLARLAPCAVIPQTEYHGYVFLYSIFKKLFVAQNSPDFLPPLQAAGFFSSIETFFTIRGFRRSNNENRYQ
jgi:hypothetical protein